MLITDSLNFTAEPTLFMVTVPVTNMSGILPIGTAEAAPLTHEAIGFASEGKDALAPEGTACGGPDLVLPALALAAVAFNVVYFRRDIFNGLSRLFADRFGQKQTQLQADGRSLVPGPEPEPEPERVKNAQPDYYSPTALSLEQLLKALQHNPGFMRTDGWRAQAWQQIQSCLEPEKKEDLEDAFFSAMIVEGNFNTTGLDIDGYLPSMGDPQCFHTRVRPYKKADPLTVLPKPRASYSGDPVFGVAHVVGMLKAGGTMYLTPERLIDILDHMSLHGLSEDYHKGGLRNMVTMALYAAIADGIFKDPKQSEQYAILTKQSVDVWAVRQDWAEIAARVFS